MNIDEMLMSVLGEECSDAVINIDSMQMSMLIEAGARL